MSPEPHGQSNGNDTDSKSDEGSHTPKLACTHCRARKVKCDHQRPRCKPCGRAGIKCEWPSGRKRKRTKTEMEEHRRLMEQGISNEGGGGSAAPSQFADLKATNLTESNDWLDLLSQPLASSSTYVWPTVFQPQNYTPGPIKQVSTAQSDPFSSLETGYSPSTNWQLMNALQNQSITIQGNPGEDQALQLYYYRFSGSTAIQPGVNRINLRLRRKKVEPMLTMVPQPEAENAPSSIPRHIEDLFDGEGMPMVHIREPLFELFYQHLSQHFPAISRSRMNDRFESGTMSQFLANCICALAVRFQDSAQGDPLQAAAPFIAKAQEFIVPLAQLPTTETTSGLILLAWASYGQGNESGLWQYSGMAIRMGMDIGIHEISEIYDSPQHLIRTRLLFWTLFITDRMVAFSTGRPSTIPEECIEIQLPEDQDLFPDPSRNTPDSPVEAVEPVPFVYFVRLMVIVGRISNVLNGRRGRPRTLVSTVSSEADLLGDLQVRLVQFLGSLPESLRWDSDNFKHQEARGHGGMFLALHLWAHALLALTYHPELLKSPSGMETPLSRSMSRNQQLALSSSRQIAECTIYADLAAKLSYTSTPYLTQPLFVAAMAFIHELRPTFGTDTSGNSTEMFFVSMARQNFVTLLKAISSMARVWAGADPVIELLERRSGVARPSSALRRNVFISLPDSGLLRRFTANNDHPKNIAQPTETSLRESIVRSQADSQSPFWLSDLMNGYTVETASFDPANPSDLAQLLSSAGSAGTESAVVV